MSGAAALEADQQARMERYYRLHARIYDATRWSFLFGRSALIARAARLARPRAILEIGCGTGTTMRQLARAFPEAAIVGVDTAEAMLRVAQRTLAPLGGRVALLHGAYTAPLHQARPFDLVVCSYALSMINPGWEAVIAHAHADLAPGGLIAVVDFHRTASPAFRRWMGVNHVRMDGHLLPALETRFAPTVVETRRAYGGLWEYYTFIGSNQQG